MIAIYFVLSAVLLALFLFGFIDISRFLQSHTSIDNAVHLSLFKTLARRNMFAALCYLALGLPWIFLGMYLVWTTGGIGLLAVLSMSVPGYFLGRKLKKLESQARSIECHDEKLREEYQRVGESWTKKALPDF